MTREVRAYLKAKAVLLALILDPSTTRDNNRVYVVELAFMDYVNARDELAL